MRSTIPLLVVGLSLATLGGWSGVRAHAAEESKDMTRVTIAISGGPVAYTDQLRENPPAIVIEFRSRNVKAELEPLVVVNAGMIKEIQSDYYPPGRRVLKSLTLRLVQPVAYSITQQANHIVIDIKTPPGLLPGRMAMGGGLTILGIEARETLLQRLKVMGNALQQTAPPVTAEPVKPKPIVVTQPVQIPVAIVQPAQAPMPVSRKGLGGFLLGVLLGIGAACLTVVGWSRWRKAALRQAQPAAAQGLPAAPAEQAGASVLEQLALKAIQRQGKTVVSSKAIAGLGTLWTIQKDEQRQGLVCLGDDSFLGRKVLEHVCAALQQEGLRSGSVIALGTFTAPAQSFAKETGISLIPREEAFTLMDVELKSAALVLDEETLKQQLAGPQGELAKAQERIKTLEQELAAKVELYAKLSQEADQLKAKSAEVDQRLAAEQEKRAQLEAQIAHLPARPEDRGAGGEEQVKVQGTKETINEVVAGEPSVPQERRKLARLDLSRREGKGILVRATAEDGEPLNGDARNVSAGGICLELSKGERLADEFELKLFFPDRPKPIEAIGKIMWKGQGTRRRLEQLGVAFSTINAPDQEAIKDFVEERKPEPVTVG